MKTRKNRGGVFLTQTLTLLILTLTLTLTLFSINYFHLRQEAVLFVRDSEVDRQAAESSGVKFVAYKNKKIAAGTFIEDHLALLRLAINN